MPLILSGNVASAIGGGYEVANSCKFDSGSSAYMKKAQSGGNREKWTFSTWIKKTLKVANNIIINPIGVNIAFNTTHTLYMDISGVGRMFETNAVFRDPSAWYHIVVAFNTTDYSTVSAGQVKVYVNGVEQTFASTVNMSSGFDSGMNESGVDIGIGRDESGDTNYADQYLAETVLIDGQQLAATSFGEFDEDSPTIWKPIDVSGLTFGTNGFYLDYEDSSNLGNDANGGTDFTESGLAATDQTTDTPTNNFATMNPLDNFYYGATFSEGNLKLVQPSSTECYITSTIAVSSGKWYWEIKITSSGSGRDFVGIGDKVAIAADFTPFSGNSNMLSYYGYTGDSKAGSTGTSYGDTFTTGDIIGVAMDLDNNKLYFSKNGTFQDSGDPTSGATGTGALSINASPADDVWYAQFANIHNTASTFEANFGNPTFTISSGNADDNGYGNFEYDVPSGYYALCTKNLGEFGG